MSKLGYETKGNFQEHFFGELMNKYFEGGNARESKNVAGDIAGIIHGLSLAYDSAEEDSQE